MMFEEWVKSVPQDLKQDALWQFNVYPKALFLYDLLWEDCRRMMKDVRGRAITEQIIRSAGSICANIEEGYGRGFGAEFAYFLRVSLGSARETRGWYYRACRLLPKEALQHRMQLLDEIIGGLVNAIDYQKRRPKRKP
ncbi:MAG TPA: four helix bundle protein [Anaerolineae bacterium]